MGRVREAQQLRGEFAKWLQHRQQRQQQRQVAAAELDARAAAAAEAAERRRQGEQQQRLQQQQQQQQRQAAAQEERRRQLVEAQQAAAAAAERQRLQEEQQQRRQQQQQQAAAAGSSAQQREQQAALLQAVRQAPSWTQLRSLVVAYSQALPFAALAAVLERLPQLLRGRQLGTRERSELGELPAGVGRAVRCLREWAVTGWGGMQVALQGCAALGRVQCCCGAGHVLHGCAPSSAVAHTHAHAWCTDTSHSAPAHCPCAEAPGSFHTCTLCCCHPRACCIQPAPLLPPPLQVTCWRGWAL
jgi:hypothetical protein